MWSVHNRCHIPDSRLLNRLYSKKIQPETSGWIENHVGEKSRMVTNRVFSSFLQCIETMEG